MKPLLTWSLAGSVAASLVAAYALPNEEQDAVTRGEAAALLPPTRARAPRVLTNDPTGVVRSNPTRALRTAPWPPPRPVALTAWDPTVPEAAEQAQAVRAATSHVAPSAASVPAAGEASAAPEPGPPAFPYRWIGHLDDGGSVQVFLASAQTTLLAQIGDVIDRQWRVDSLDSQMLQLTWLPSGAAVQVRAR